MRCAHWWANLVDVLALELLEESSQALIIGLSANRREDVLDVGGGRGGVAGEAEEEVGGEVLHFSTTRLQS